MGFFHDISLHLYNYLKRTLHDPIAGFTGLLFIATAILAWIAVRQMRDTRILQEQGGIISTTEGTLIGHVKFKNVGHLPASDFRWFLDVTPNDDGGWKPPEVGRLPDERGVCQIGARIIRGSRPFGVPSQQYIYVWGRVTYLDGFGLPRFTEFCHRYNTAVRSNPTSGDYDAYPGEIETGFFSLNKEEARKFIDKLEASAKECWGES